MSEPPLKSLADYSRLVAETLDRPDVQRSTVVNLTTRLALSAANVSIDLSF